MSEWKYQGEDVLPEGFYDAPLADQDAWWTSRAQYLSKQKQQTREKWDALMTEVEERNQAIANCHHRETRIVHYPQSEIGGVVLDPASERRCADPDCNKLLEVSV